MLGLTTLILHFVQALQDWWQANKDADGDVRMSPEALLGLM